AYMSPEQGLGNEADHRSDIWSFGVVLYEMITGQAPLQGDYEQAIMYAMINEEPPPPKELRGEISNDMQRIILRALKKDRQNRFQSSAGLIRELRHLRGEQTTAGFKTLDSKTLLSLIRQPRVVVLGLVALLIITAAIFLPYRRVLQVQSAMEKLPEIERLATAGNYFEAYQLAVDVERHLEKDSTFARLMPSISDKLTLITEPEGASVYLKRFAPGDPEQPPERTYIGVTPIKDLRLGRSDYKVTIEKQGYAPVQRIASSALNRNEASFGVSLDIKIEVKLHKIKDIQENMVFVQGGEYKLVGSGAPTKATVQLDDYFMDRYEVSNREYQEFVKAGGYLQKSFWKLPFMENGQTLSWETAMRRFRDRTGLAGPRNWVNQEYSQGKGNHPVTGISWYEAAAYAEFVGKRLPTVFQWEKAARDGLRTRFVGLVMPWGVVSSEEATQGRANFGGRDTVPVDSYEFGLSPFGCYNMGGNVREWCLNERAGGFVTTGGSWEGPSYLFGIFGALPGLNSTSSLGFRCVKMPAGAWGDQGSMRFRKTLTTSYRPVDDTTFNGFLGYYKYDKKPLDSKIVETIETEYWTREKVIFAGLSKDWPVIAYVYLPKRAAKPFQCINLVPGGDIFFSRSASEYAEWLLAAHIKAGRAVMSMVPRGGVERPPSADYVSPEPHTVEYRERTVRWVTEYRIALDYLATRGDIDMDKIAYFGFSWGGIGLLPLTAVEDRYRSIILIGGGVYPGMLSHLPEANEVNFVPRIKPPKLMLHGRYDEVQTFETWALPLYNLMKEPKRLEAVESGHMPPVEIRVPIINDWLDETMGPVKFE
ncbi:SUMF1/EgtB/PvdO family nonheme iron enzyme, partial [bacterium]|nr:SUMF1/EgtB/PvdO family nonheme iron enzyme [bacterium]